MLDVERRVDIDPGRAEFLDVAPSLGVAASWRIGVRQFVDQYELASGCRSRVEIEVLDGAPLKVHRPELDLGEPFKELLSFLAVVGFDDANRNIHTFIELLSCRQEHRVSLPDASASAEEYLEMTPRFVSELF